MNVLEKEKFLGASLEDVGRENGGPCFGRRRGQGAVCPFIAFAALLGASRRIAAHRDQAARFPPPWRNEPRPSSDGGLALRRACRPRRSTQSGRPGWRERLSRRRLPARVRLAAKRRHHRCRRVAIQGVV